jgi:hypothetical protein
MFSIYDRFNQTIPIVGCTPSLFNHLCVHTCIHIHMHTVSIRGWSSAIWMQKAEELACLHLHQQFYKDSCCETLHTWGKLLSVSHLAWERDSFPSKNPPKSLWFVPLSPYFYSKQVQRGWISSYLLKGLTTLGYHHRNNTHAWEPGPKRATNLAKAFIHLAVIKNNRIVSDWKHMQYTQCMGNTKSQKYT